MPLFQNESNAVISGHPGGLTPGTYGGIVRDLPTVVTNFWPGTGALVRTTFALPMQDTQGKTCWICNIAAILKMKDPDHGVYIPVVSDLQGMKLNLAVCRKQVD